MDRYKKYYAHIYSKVGVVLNEYYVISANMLFVVLRKESRKVGFTGKLY
jgi:hypothetical protein